MRLADVPLGTAVVLVGRGDGEVPPLRLAELGLRPGARVVVLHRTAGGGRVVGVGHGRVALDRTVTTALEVAPR